MPSDLQPVRPTPPQTTTALSGQPDRRRQPAPGLKGKAPTPGRGSTRLSAATVRSRSRPGRLLEHFPRGPGMEGAGMGRRVRLKWPADRTAAGPVEVRSVSAPQDGWTLPAAVGLLADGYGLAATARRTGYTAAHLRAAAAADAGVTDLRP